MAKATLSRREETSFANSKPLADKRWIAQELKGCQLKDARLTKRLGRLFEDLAQGMGESIPFACQDWANTKAAYRFFSNDRVSEQAILQGHFQATRQRFQQTSGTVLILHDTTSFTYERNNPSHVGSTYQLPVGKDLFGRPSYYTLRGLMMHGSLAVTPTGLPLGLAAVKFWTRQRFKGCNALKRTINPTRVAIEEKESYRWIANLQHATTLLEAPDRCVHIGDRESDIYELFCMTQTMGTHFLVRTCVDRLARDQHHTLADEMETVQVKGRHRIDCRDRRGHLSSALLAIKYHRLKVLPPIGKQKRYPELWLTVIHAVEHTQPQNREKIVWKLMTDLPITSCQEAIEKLNWYAMRWKIETFHKILKSGCKAETAKLRTAERLVKLIAVFCVLSWRIFWMTMITRCHAQAQPSLALTPTEMALLDSFVKNKFSRESKTLADYMIKVARLGGYLARASDPPPGNRVIWRGLIRLTDMMLGFQRAVEVMGN